MLFNAFHATNELIERIQRFKSVSSSTDIQQLFSMKTALKFLKFAESLLANNIPAASSIHGTKQFSWDFIDVLFVYFVS